MKTIHIIKFCISTLITIFGATYFLLEGGQKTISKCLLIAGLVSSLYSIFFLWSTRRRET